LVTSTQLSLPLSQETISRLYKWAVVYNTTLNWDSPTNSPGFSSPEVEADFDEEAIRLWKQLQIELAPDYEVIYFSDILGKIVTDENQLDVLHAHSQSL
jgi:hypothetical protein